MNKVVVGILAVVLLIFIGGAAVGWVVVVKPLWQAGSEFVGASKQLMELAELEQQVRNQSDFDRPQADRLSPAHVERFVAVQAAIERSLGDELEPLNARFAALNRTMDGDDGEPTVSEVFAAFGDLAGVLITAKRAQVEALNAVDMSLDEYRYLRVHGFIAAGIAQDMPLWSLEEGSYADNLALLRPHRELLLRTLSAAELLY
jgi:hypothetical protein